MKKVLLTCPPMIQQINNYIPYAKKLDLNIEIPKFTQVMSEEDLIKIIGNYDAWIIGDDPATEKVFEEGVKGNLKCAVKWGVGVDNVDFNACKKLDLPITNIPGVFGEEVSDVAIGYLLMLSRKLHTIHNNNLDNKWIKPAGISLSKKKVCLVGFGDIGRCTARKLLSFNMDVWVSDPGFYKVGENIISKNNIEIDDRLKEVNISDLNECIKNADFIIVTCALNKFTKGLINKNNIILANKGVYLINVARGPIINENDVVELLENKFISAVGFDVFEIEPLSKDNKLRNNENNIFGSHNGSNSIDAVNRVSKIALEKVHEFLNM